VRRRDQPKAAIDSTSPNKGDKDGNNLMSDLNDFIMIEDMNYNKLEERFK